MAGIAPADLQLPADERPLFTAESDISSAGLVGQGRLVVTATTVSRYESPEPLTPGPSPRHSSGRGEHLVASWPLSELSDAKVEDLVDATAVVAKHNGSTVELLRAS